MGYIPTRLCVRFKPRGNEIFNIFILFALVMRQSTAFNFATQHTMPPEFSGKWGMEVLERDGREGKGVS